MPTLDAHQSNRSIKLLLLGDSGTGKTGALASLVAADYKLRILDLDNGLDPLKVYAPHDKLKNVSFKTIRDKYKATQLGAIVDGIPSAYVEALKSLTDWGEGLGKPSDWPDDNIVVIDSLSLLSRAAYDWADALNPGAKDKRQVYGQAQNSIMNVIAMLTSEHFKPSVIVIAHVKYQEYQDGTTKGFPTAVGTAIGPEIMKFFSHAGLVEKTGTGNSLQRVIRFSPTAVVDAKSPLQFAAPLPVATGLATFFAQARK